MRNLYKLAIKTLLFKAYLRRHNVFMDPSWVKPVNNEEGDQNLKFLNYDLFSY